MTVGYLRVAVVADFQRLEYALNALIDALAPVLAAHAAGLRFDLAVRFRLVLWLAALGTWHRDYSGSVIFARPGSSPRVRALRSMTARRISASTPAACAQ